MCTGSVQGTWPRLGVYTSLFLTGRGGDVLATRKARLVENGFSCLDGPPDPACTPSCPLPSCCSSSTSHSPQAWPRSLLGAGRWCDKGSCPHTLSQSPLPSPPITGSGTATQETRSSKRSCLPLEAPWDDGAEDGKDLNDRCSVVAQAA